MSARAPRLIVLNGPPGIGKSTVAGRYLDAHPFALSVDPDPLRRMIGGWRDDPLAAVGIARERGLVLAREHLGSGRDVVIPQYLGNTGFLAQAEAVATESGASFHEVLLMCERDEAVRRFTQRTVAAASAADVEAGRIIESLGGPDALFVMYDRLLLVIAHRPHAHRVISVEGDVDGTYRAVTGLLHREQ